MPDHGFYIWGAYAVTFAALFALIAFCWAERRARRRTVEQLETLSPETLTPETLTPETLTPETLTGR